MEPLISGVSISSALDQLSRIYLHYSIPIWIWHSFWLISPINVSRSLQNSVWDPLEIVNLNIDGDQYHGWFPKIYGVHFRRKIDEFKFFFLNLQSTYQTEMYVFSIAFIRTDFFLKCQFEMHMCMYPCQTCTFYLK